jgi:hypothetical protein
MGGTPAGAANSVAYIFQQFEAYIRNAYFLALDSRTLRTLSGHPVEFQSRREFRRPLSLTKLSPTPLCTFIR